MKRWSILLAGMVLFVPCMARGQLLFKEGQEQENFARTGYERYGTSLINRAANPRFDSFGNYLMFGVRAFDWHEERKNTKHITPSEAYSSINKTNDPEGSEFFRTYLNNLVVAHETQKSFSTRFMVGNEIRVKFSPLILDINAFNGVRWDFDISNTQMTFISSRADLPIWLDAEAENVELTFRKTPVMMNGGHIERKFGLFNVAASYVNTYLADSQQSRVNNSITGTLPYNAGAPPSGDATKKNPVLMLVVKIEDGSRQDGGGPRVFDIYPKINGNIRKDSLVGITTGSWTKDWHESAQLMNNPAKDLYENRYFLDPRRVPQYDRFMNRGGLAQQPEQYIWTKASINDPASLRDFSAITGTEQDYLEVNGEDYLQFWFELPQDEEVSDVEFWSLIGNDYKISISEVDYSDYTRTKTVSTYFNTVKEAPGNIKDMSNYGWVKFRHGHQLADMLMGIRIDSHFKDFDFVMEYNKNYNWRQYYDTNAKKYRYDAEAYYINLKKSIGKFTVGTEYFKIEPDYTTVFENFDQSYLAMKVGDQSTWGTEFNDDVGLSGGSDNPNGSLEPQQYMNYTMVTNMVEDNDDKDRYADFHLFSQMRDRNGVYPGLDKNGNNRPDTNENDNQVPDYAEPFLLYYVDPDSYDFGYDLNNNGVIDERENDDKPDYPYNLDSKGYHVFTSYGDEQGMKYTAGLLNTEQIAGGGKTDVRYGKMEYNKFIPFFADVSFASMLKKVKDDISDNVFSYERRLSTTLIDSFTYTDNTFRTREGIQQERYYDQLSYRDSYSSTSMFQTKLFRIPNLTVHMKLLYDINHQNENSFQAESDIIRRSQIYKADYKYYIKDLLITPQIKFMSQKLTYTNNRYMRTFHEQYFYPIIRAEYPITLNTKLKAGAQGLPGLNSTVRNLVNDQLDYDERHYTFMITNRSLYQGYDFALNFGYEVNWQEFNGLMRKPYNRTDKVFFIRLIVGTEPIS